MKNQNKPIYKIYSRKRLHLGFFNNSRNNKYITKIKKIFPFIIIILIAIITCYMIWKSIYPIFETLCEDQAKAIATKVTNEETSRVLSKYNYNSFFTIEKDEDGNVQMITANVLQINQVTSDIALYIQNALKENENNEVYISTGSLTGIKLFSGSGPRIPIQLATVGNVLTDLKSEFVAQGVNQTLHRIYMEVVTTVNILTPFSTIEKSITNQVLIAENVIIGNIPSTYYNLNGIDNQSDLLEMVE